jgi:hypothetical protein
MSRFFAAAASPAHEAGKGEGDAIVSAIVSFLVFLLVVGHFWPGRNTHFGQLTWPFLSTLRDISVLPDNYLSIFFKYVESI